MNRETFLESFGHIADAPGGIDKLRSLILDLAMRGRLTGRQITDEPATALLQRAREAKAALIADGRIRKPTAYGPVAPDDEPYPLPTGWAWCRTVDLIHTVNGRAFKPTEWSNSGLPIIRIQNLNNPAAPFNYFSGCVDEQHLVEPGDLLISWSGTPGTSFGSFVWYGPVGVLNQHIFKCNLFEDYRDFICLAINSRLDVLIDDAHGGVGLQHFTKDKLERLPLAIPPMQEQQRIVQRVRELMDLCDELGQRQEAKAEVRSALTASALNLITEAGSADLRDTVRAFADNIGLHLAPGDGDLAAIKRVREAILDLAARGRLTHQDSADEPATALIERITSERARLVRAGAIRRPQSVTAMREQDMPFAAPPGWSWCRLGGLLVTPLANGRSVPTRDDGFPVLRLTAMRGEIIDLGEYKGGDWTAAQARPYLVEGGDILVARGNGSISLVGRASRVADDIGAARVAYPDTMIRMQPPRDAVDSAFLTLLWNSPLVRTQVELKARTTAGIYKVSQDDLREVSLPIPPLNEQGRIVRRVTALFVLCDALETQLNAARALRGDVAASVAAHARGIVKSCGWVD